MARDIFGNKKRNLDTESSHKRYQTTEWDITKEKIKMLLWVILGFLYGYYVVLGNPIF